MQSIETKLKRSHTRHVSIIALSTRKCWVCRVYCVAQLGTHVRDRKQHDTIQSPLHQCISHHCTTAPVTTAAPFCCGCITALTNDQWTQINISNSSYLCFCCYPFHQLAGFMSSDLPIHPLAGLMSSDFPYHQPASMGLSAEIFIGHCTCIVHCSI